MKNICFFFPGIARGPIGGYKVVYEYANRLVNAGWNVTLYYPCVMSFRGLSFKQKVKCLLKFPIVKILKIYKQKWFKLNPLITEVYNWNPQKKHFQSFSHIVATYIDTAFLLDEFSLYKNCKCFYFIQGFESWNNNSEEKVYKSYKLPLRKIVISPWLSNKVNQVGESSEILFNGFDFSYFRLLTKIEDRNRFEISMLYHENENKRCVDAVEALTKVKEVYPELHVNVFGIPSRPKHLPLWFSYSQNPDCILHNQILNKSSIYIAASANEGFGLTVGEAMICGCAIACTNNEGFSIMVNDGITGLLSNVKDVQGLANNIIRLINDDQLRISLAKSGNDTIKQFSWEKSEKKLEAILNG